MKFKLPRNTPLIFVVLLLLNLIPVILLEAFALYRTPAPPTQEDWAKADPRYENAIIVPDTRTGTTFFTLYRIETPEGELDIVPVATNPFFHSRTRIYKGKTKHITQDSQTISFLIGLHASTYHLENGKITSSSSTGYNMQSMALKYLLISGALAALEWWLIEKLRGNA